MKQMYNKNLVSNAAELRRNMTKEERRLWYDFLRGYPVRFTRQKIIEGYIADFYCGKAKLVVELDGSQHYDGAAMERDAQRTKCLESFGLTVLRIPNNEVNGNFEGVCEYIDACVKNRII